MNLWEMDLVRYVLQGLTVLLETIAVSAAMFHVFLVMYDITSFFRNILLFVRSWQDTVL